jgi:hypothetical protein
MGTIEPISRAARLSRAPWRAEEAHDSARPIEEVSPLAPAPTPPPAAKPAAAFAAQLIAGPERRGLRRGPPVLDDAKSAYLGAEWSGRADRRTRSGRITQTEV